MADSSPPAPPQAESSVVPAGVAPWLRIETVRVPRSRRRPHMVARRSGWRLKLGTRWAENTAPEYRDWLVAQAVARAIIAPDYLMLVTSRVVWLAGLTLYLLGSQAGYVFSSVLSGVAAVWSQVNRLLGGRTAEAGIVLALVGLVLSSLYDRQRTYLLDATVASWGHPITPAIASELRREERSLWGLQWVLFGRVRAARRGRSNLEPDDAVGRATADARRIPGTSHLRARSDRSGTLLLLLTYLAAMITTAVTVLAGFASPTFELFVASLAAVGGALVVTQVLLPGAVGLHHAWAGHRARLPDSTPAHQ